MNKIKIEKASIYKLCMTICLAMILSMFIFACGSSRDTSSGTDTSAVIQDTSGAMRDTASTTPMNPDTTSRSMPPDTMH